MDRDVQNKYMFASLQSDEGNFLVNKYGVDVIKNDSIILIEENKYYLRSTAALRISKNLKGAWKLFYIFIIIPPAIRDFFYNIIANHRYKWFGKREACRIPTPGEKAKFL